MIRKSHEQEKITLVGLRTVLREFDKQYRKGCVNGNKWSISNFGGNDWWLDYNGKSVILCKECKVHGTRNEYENVLKKLEVLSDKDYHKISDVIIDELN